MIADTGKLLSIADSARVIREGGVVAYPTESCYGLGCDPRNSEAVRRILKIKRRPAHKGLILITDHVRRLAPYITGLPDATREQILSSWPGPNTWIIPARKHTSKLVRGSHDSIAVRVTSHRVSRELCRASAMALISTSANRATRPPHRRLNQLMADMGDELDGVVMGRLGFESSPSTIRHGDDGRVLRA